MKELTEKQNELICLIRKGYELDCYYVKEDCYWKYYLKNKKGRLVRNVNGIIVRKLKEKNILSKNGTLTEIGKGV